MKMLTLLSLPHELLEAIVSNLSQSDLGALIRSHRRFYFSLIYYLYQYNKRHFGGSALRWGAWKGVMETVQRSIQQNFDLEIQSEYRSRHADIHGYYMGRTPLQSAIARRDYAMVRLLIESGAKVHKIDIKLATYHSCQTMIWKDTPQDWGYQTTPAGMGPDEPRSRAFRAAMQLGHNELVDLVCQVDIPSVYKPIWPLLTKAVRFCEANVSIIQLLLIQEASRKSFELLLKGDTSQSRCCDTTLKLLYQWRKRFYRSTYSADPIAASSAAFCGNNSMLNTLLEMGADLNYIDSHNRTPLIWAAHAGRFKTFMLLVEKGADKDLSRKSNITTLSMAREIGSFSIGRTEPIWWQDKEEKRRIVTYLLTGAKNDIIKKWLVGV